MPDLHPLLDEPPTRRSQRHAHRRVKKRRRGRRFLVLLLALAVVLGGGSAAYSVLRPMVASFMAPDDYTGAGTGHVRVTILTGASGKEIGQALQQAGVVKSASAFVDAFSASPKAAAIQPGTYELRSHMSSAAAVTLLLDPSSRLTERVTIREGLRATEIVAALAKASGKPVSAYTAALKDTAALGLPPAAKGNVEGFLFPATYDFEPDSTPAQQLQAMVQRSAQEIAALGVPDAQLERVLTIASIAEVEAQTPADYAKVAQVLDNRIAKGMKLQLDSTVSYAVGKRTITTTNADRAVHSAYNTYYVTGLPPGPISNPGRAAIEGALHPTPGPWLYFVTVDPANGTTKFATTAAEHAANVRLFRQWCQAHPGKC